jgi:hypothetical protein
MGRRLRVDFRVGQHSVPSKTAHGFDAVFILRHAKQVVRSGIDHGEVRRQLDVAQPASARVEHRVVKRVGPRSVRGIPDDLLQLEVAHPQISGSICPSHGEQGKPLGESHRGEDRVAPPVFIRRQRFRGGGPAVRSIPSPEPIDVSARDGCGSPWFSKDRLELAVQRIHADLGHTSVRRIEAAARWRHPSDRAEGLPRERRERAQHTTCAAVRTEANDGHGVGGRRVAGSDRPREVAVVANEATIGEESGNRDEWDACRRKDAHGSYVPAVAGEHLQRGVCVFHRDRVGTEGEHGVHLAKLPWSLPCSAERPEVPARRVEQAQLVAPGIGDDDAPAGQPGAAGDVVELIRRRGLASDLE